MNRNRYRIAASVLLMIAALIPFASADGAVAYRGAGHGGALVVPLWSIGVGTNFAGRSTDTLLTLTNHANAPSAVKLRIIDAQGGEAAAFNVYLDGRDSFAGALFADPDAGGQGALVTRDGSCLIPEFAAGDDPGARRLPLSGSALGGYIEIIDMGRADPASGLTRESENSFSDVIRWIDCQELDARFETEWQSNPAAGLLPPAGALSAEAQLIDVFAGANATFAAVALSGFSDIVQHTAPGATMPNLASAHTADTGAGTTVSRVCLPDACRDYEWDRPIDAVASVLTVRRLRGDINVKPGINADSEMVLISPLARYAADNPPAVTGETELVVHARDGEPVWLSESDVSRPGSNRQTLTSTGDKPRASPAPPRPTPILLSSTDIGEPIQTILFSAEPVVVDDSTTSGLLGLPVSVAVTLDESFAVRAEVSLYQDRERRLISRSGHEFVGLPVIGLVVRQFTNGTLLDPDLAGERVLANYRGPERMSSERTIRLP